MDEQPMPRLLPEQVEDLLRRRRSVLLEILELAMAGLPREDFLRRSLTLLLDGQVTSLMPRGAAFLYDPASQAVVLTAQVGLDPEGIESCSMVPLDCCACGRAAERGQIVVERHDVPDRRHRARCGVAESHVHCSVPLARDGRLEGVLALMYRAGSNPGADERLFLERVARGIAGALMLSRRARELADRVARAESESRAGADYTATVIHELRTPLNGILGTTELLCGTGLDGEQSEYAQTLRESALDLSRLVDALLDRARIEAGELPVERVPYDLCELAESVITLVSPAAPTEVALRLRVAANAPRRIEGDPARVKQVLLNLLGNALKFTTEGEVLLSIHREPDPGGDLLYCAVQDTGPGIPAERQQAIFDRWQQEDGSTSRRFGGSGLGLSISRRLVELMGGRIGVHSVPGEGSVFWFTLPLLETVDEPAPAESDDSLSGRLVLLVERDASPGLILEEQLRAWGLDVVRAEGSAQALAQLRAGSRPWAVLVGHDRDGGSAGFPAAVRQLAGEDGPHLVKISTLSERRGGGRLPADGYARRLLEPVRGQLLRHALESLLEPAQPPECSLPEQTPPAPLSLQVLVVDDNPVNLRVASRMLERIGCEADSAAGGAEALERLSGKRYDVVLLDWRMPEIDGPEVARRVAADPSRYGQPRLIGLTAATESESRGVFSAVGVEVLLHKPLDIESLSAALRAATSLPVSA